MGHPGRAEHPARDSEHRGRQRDGCEDQGAVLNMALGAQSVWRKGTWRMKSIARKAELPFSCLLPSP